MRKILISLSSTTQSLAAHLYEVNDTVIRDNSQPKDFLYSEEKHSDSVTSTDIFHFHYLIATAID